MDPAGFLEYGDTPLSMITGSHRLESAPNRQSSQRGGDHSRMKIAPNLIPAACAGLFGSKPSGVYVSGPKTPGIGLPKRWVNSAWCSWDQRRNALLATMSRPAMSSSASASQAAGPEVPRELVGV